MRIHQNQQQAAAMASAVAVHHQSHHSHHNAAAVAAAAAAAAALASSGHYHHHLLGSNENGMINTIEEENENGEDDSIEEDGSVADSLIHSRSGVKLEELQAVSPQDEDETNNADNENQGVHSKKGRMTDFYQRSGSNGSIKPSSTSSSSSTSNSQYSISNSSSFPYQSQSSQFFYQQHGFSAQQPPVATSHQSQSAFVHHLPSTATTGNADVDSHYGHHSSANIHFDSYSQQNQHQSMMNASSTPSSTSPYLQFTPHSMSQMNGFSHHHHHQPSFNFNHHHTYPSHHHHHYSGSVTSTADHMSAIAAQQLQLQQQLMHIRKMECVD